MSVATQPMLIRSFSRAAERRGLSSPDPEIVLPLQISRHFVHGNVGARQALTPHVILLGSIGTQISGREGARARVVFYLGAQLVF